MQRVLLFRSELLPISETFIAAQAGAMQQFDPWFAGVKRVRNGIELDESRVTTVTRDNRLQDKILRRIYTRIGISPRFFCEIENVKPALIHAHFATDACAALPIQSHLEIPLVVTLHGYDVTSSDDVLSRSDIGRLYLRRRERLWDQASVFFCVSEHIHGAAMERGFPKDKLWVHRIGVDISASRQEPASACEPIVLFVGRLVEKKGCAHLLRAMTVVERALSDCRLVILGDGPLRPALEMQACCTLHRYEFLGAQPAKVVRDWMQRARVLVAPSVVAASGDSEGLPIALCEAQAMGLPVVGFRGPGVCEAVTDGETGMLVRQRDERALADAILAVLRDDGLANDMGSAGAQRARLHFNLGAQTRLLEEKYREVLR